MFRTIVPHPGGDPCGTELGSRTEAAMATNLTTMGFFSDKLRSGLRQTSFSFVVIPQSAVRRPFLPRDNPTLAVSSPMKRCMATWIPRRKCQSRSGGNVQAHGT
jgi:hypothetical protein